MTTTVKEDRQPQVLLQESAWDLLNESVPEPAWLIKNFMPEPQEDQDGLKVMIGGPPKSFKSTLALELAVSLTTHTDFVGHYPMKSGRTYPVLYIDEENSRRNHRATLAGIVNARPGWNVTVHEPDPDGHVLPLVNWGEGGLDFEEVSDFSFIRQQRLRLQDADCRSDIIETINDGGYEWVFFDSLYRLLPGYDLDKGHEASRALDHIDEIRTATGVNIVIIHHAGKTRKGTGNVGDQMMHSTYLRAWYDTLIFSAKEGGSNYVKVETEHRELQDVVPMGLQMEDLGKWKVGDHANKKTREMDERIELVTRWVESNRETIMGFTTKKAVIERLQSEWNYTASFETAKNDLQQLGFWDEWGNENNNNY